MATDAMPPTSIALDSRIVFELEKKVLTEWSYDGCKCQKIQTNNVDDLPMEPNGKRLYFKASSSFDSKAI